MKGDIVNNIPQFLQHLPIWKANPLDEVKAPKQKKEIKPVKTHQFDVTDRMSNHVVEKVCQICGTPYKVAYRLRNIKKTCSASCGQKMRLSKKEPEAWVNEAVELKKQGLTLSDIALRVNKATSTVWTYLKKRGY